ncbi:rhomboid family intramembrane serine protease [Flavobacterium oreochromis]|uniref:Rhomboid family intramembrane serine protease n=2 Tax=Flavobacterium TaxID=237 RepID=A0A246GC85_9FLAO|nr:rhomboid family intramembrane serine protease [Flavobacterium oreochromis]OWP77900.1 rhomboid family intramembrane serine protease [Flavobacterium oreochromis]OWP78618.1 rhomboid family intramembrane serine protease [Flavobacterium oreochromis]POR30609.1 rhomboid family intramembrane serine protease [Flavobacterium columnare]QYS85621.1 rhomboid family intramembrane serine protease [Flavobacterium oreochromis]
MNILEDLKQQYRVGDLTIKLIFWNILLFVFPTLIVSVLKLIGITFNFYEWVALSSDIHQLSYKPWSLVSYCFFHSGWIHLVFNTLMLHFAGRIFTTYFTQKQLLSVYVLGGLFAGLIYILTYLILPFLSNQSVLLVGASASIMAIVYATATYQPYMNVRLALFGNVYVWQIALVFLIIDLVQLPLENTGGHISHLGGAFFGFIYIKLLKKGVDLGKGLSGFLDNISNLFNKKKATPFKTVHKNATPSKNEIKSKIVRKDKTQQQIDEILDKISQSGYESLTKEEKEFLFRAGK